MKVNVIITGQIRSAETFNKSIVELISLKKEGVVDKIILSTWEGELDKLDSNSIKKVNDNMIVITPKPPSIQSSSIFYQMKSFHCGLDEVVEHSSFIFKTRPDLVIKQEHIKEIIKLNNTITCKSSPFINKVWVPWFEITKPFYLADECFYCSYTDAHKLYNYNTIYDNYYDIDAGISHIRRFYEPFIALYPEFANYFKHFGISGHGTDSRFPIFNLMKKSNAYLYSISTYYKILDENFNIGISEYGYIDFREWNQKYNQTEITNLINSVTAKGSFDPKKGHNYAYTSNDVIRLRESMAVTEPLNEKLYSDGDKVIKLKAHMLKNAIPPKSFMYRLKRKLQRIIC